jgi:hypothetical protein
MLHHHSLPLNAGQTILAGVSVLTQPYRQPACRTGTSTVTSGLCGRQGRGR